MWISVERENRKYYDSKFKIASSATENFIESWNIHINLIRLALY